MKEMGRHTIRRCEKWWERLTKARATKEMLGSIGGSSCKCNGGEAKGRRNGGGRNGRTWQRKGQLGKGVELWSVMQRLVLCRTVPVPSKTAS